MNSKELKACLGMQGLYYWRSEGGKAEIDFLIELKDHVYPLEVKAGARSHSRSLNSYEKQFSSSFLIRTSLLNLKRDANIYNIPLYAISLLRTLSF